jgi:glycosyltransferase involved in cell wall biosynthesis
MSFIIFGDNFTFPEGNAATNRMLTYAKGFTELGEAVHVICFLSKYNQEPEGEYNKIRYYNAFSYPERSKSIFTRIWRNYLKYYKTFRLVSNINKSDKVIAINCESSVFSTYFFGVFLSKVFRSKFLYECNEHPLRFHQGGLLNRTIGKIKFYLEAHACDGALCISNYLVDFYKAYGVNERKLILMQSTVDTGRFATKLDIPISYKYVGYFGSLSFERDNVDLLIYAFEKIYQKHPDIKLILGGYATNTEFEQIQNLINRLEMAEKISILSYLQRDEVVQYILNAQVLVMVRSKNLESDASYPSKLTEYLSTSIPVISVSVGDVPNYLTDKENAFLIEPGNVDQLADQLDYVLSNYQFALEVGKRGKELTETIFNYKTQCDKLYKFIKSLS